MYLALSNRRFTLSFVPLPTAWEVLHQLGGEVGGDLAEGLASPRYAMRTPPARSGSPGGAPPGRRSGTGSRMGMLRFLTGGSPPSVPARTFNLKSSSVLLTGTIFSTSWSNRSDLELPGDLRQGTPAVSLQLPQLVQGFQGLAAVDGLPCAGRSASSAGRPGPRSAPGSPRPR